MRSAVETSWLSLSEII